MSQPSPTNEPGYFERYTRLVPENDLARAFARQQEAALPFLQQITETQAAFRYAPGKWSVKEMLQHITDAERIFSYRALCFARGEQQSLPGFDENEYAAASGADQRSWQQLVEEFLAVRQATRLLFESFTPDMLIRKGTANGNLMDAATIGFVLLGHYEHHVNVLRERYLNGNG